MTVADPIRQLEEEQGIEEITGLLYQGYSFPKAGGPYDRRYVP